MSTRPSDSAPSPSPPPPEVALADSQAQPHHPSYPSFPSSSASSSSTPPPSAAQAQAYSYTPPAIPTDLRASLSAWFRSSGSGARDAETAEAEYWLIQRHAGQYFQQQQSQQQQQASSSSSSTSAAGAREEEKKEREVVSVGNVRNEPLHLAWRRLQREQQASTSTSTTSSSTNSGTTSVFASENSTSTHHQQQQQQQRCKEKEKAGQRATMGLCVHAADGKVGLIRSVDLDAPLTDHDADNTAATGPSSSSWFSAGLFSSSGAAPKRYMNTVEIGDPLLSPPPLSPAPTDSASASASASASTSASASASAKAWAEEEKVVLLHGYGAGLGFFFQNLASFAQYQPPTSSEYRTSRFYAVDWLGMGRSARVPFHVARNAAAPPPASSSSNPDSAHSSGANTPPNPNSTPLLSPSTLPESYHLLAPSAQRTIARVLTAESFFTDSLEAWRAQQRLEKMTLVGHSIGGYLALAYAMRYPHRVNRLVLISPAAIGPSEWTAAMFYGSEMIQRALLLMRRRSHILHTTSFLSLCSANEQTPIKRRTSSRRRTSPRTVHTNRSRTEDPASR